MAMENLVIVFTIPLKLKVSVRFLPSLIIHSFKPHRWLLVAQYQTYHYREQVKPNYLLFTATFSNT